jgi:UDP-2-acetamido-3-amino-2,3-dideoxy-glucuronate N-acetyltransferase
MTMSETDRFWAHATACVDDLGGVGEGTRIWHFSHVMKGAIVGKNCSIGQNVFIGAGAVIGNGVKIQNNVSVYDRVTLEDGVFCGPSMVFTNVINPRSHISRKHEFRPTLVRQGATLGANATILCGVTIGRYSFIGAGAVVTKDVRDYALVYGNPGQQHGWVCRCGVKLALSVKARRKGVTCQACGVGYRCDGDKLTEP